METDYREEIDKLRREMDGLRKLVEETLNHRQKMDAQRGRVGEMNNPDDQDSDHVEKLKNVYLMKNMHPDPKVSAIMETLCKLTDEEGRTGSITYLGIFASGERQSNWIQHTINTDHLLALIENRSASTVLQCVGSNDRLNLLMALLRQPMSVASLMEKCGFNSTGQVYHHLKPLIAADIVFELGEPKKGVYAVKQHRVQGIIMLLAGIADLVDPKFSQGEWARNAGE